MKILIKGGTVVNNDLAMDADVLIEGGKIIQIESKIEDDSATVISAEGCYLLPGGVDIDTYFGVERGDVKSLEDYFSGTQAALYGGTTTVVNCLEVTKEQSLKERFKVERDLASKEITCNVAFQVSLPNFDSNNESDFKELLESNSVVPIIRVSTCNKGSHCVKMGDGQLYDTFVWCRDHDVLPTVYAENDLMIQALETLTLAKGITGPEGHYLSRIDAVEKEAVSRVLSIAEITKCPVHFDKVYSEESLKVILNKKRSSSVPIMCGTSLVALIQTAKRYMDPNWEQAASYVTMPSLKMNPIFEDGVTSLMNMVALDNINHVVSSHLVFGMKHKASGKDDFRFIIPGTSGVQYRMKVIWEKAVKSGKMSPSRFVDCTSSTPAKIANLYPRKGSISIGSDADLLIWSDQGVDNQHHEAGDINIYKDISLTCGPRMVMINGVIVVNENGECTASKGSGQIISPVRQINPRFQKSQILKNALNSKECKIMREPYTGAVYELGKENEGEKYVLYSDLVNKDIYSREGPKEDKKEALPPGQRTIRTSVKTAQPPGGSSQQSWWN